MRRIITDPGAVKLGDTILPGIYEGMEIRGEVRVDEAKIPGKSGTSRQPMGFDDAKISLRLRLAADKSSTAEEKCQVIVSVFQAVDDTAKPYIYQMVNNHTAIWGIKEVVFRGLRTMDDNRDDTMRAYLDFEEYRPVMVAVEERADISEDTSGQEDAFAEGPDSAQGSSGKSVDSPAIDDDEV